MRQLSSLFGLLLLAPFGFQPARVVAAAPTVRPAVAQAPPNQPLLAFGDQRDWIVLAPVEYVIGDTDQKIVVPAGFVTDLASIPPKLWGPPLYLTPTGQYGRAAIIHDYLYWSQKCARDQADRLLVLAMKESEVGGFDEFAIYEGVHLGGKGAWAADKSERQKGRVRTLAPQWRHPSDPNQHWPEYQAQIMAQGAKELNFPDDGSYCHYGDTTEVPKKGK